MQVFKRNKNSHYTTISNEVLRDKNLSLKAKGFIAIIMGLPDDWDFSISGMIAILKENRTAIYSTLDELKENGYCIVTQTKLPNGRFGDTIYNFYESPQSETPLSENLHTENIPQYNKELIKDINYKETTIIKEINKENKTSTDSAESSDIVRDELSESDDANVNIPTEYLNGRGETDLFNALSDSDIENSEIDKKLVIKHKEPSARWFKQIGSSKDYDILDEEDFQKFVEFRAEARKAGMRDDRSKTTAYVDFRRKYPKTDIAEVLNGFRQRKAERERDLANKEFVPMWKNMSTWINKKCWETDDMDISENLELSELSPEAQRYMSKSSAEKYLLKLEEIDRIFRETGKRIDISDAEDYILGRKIW